jgi:ABC-type multidrug transport system fused ATPase/permease subunit
VREASKSSTLRTTFFDATPIGRVLNRFSRDLDQIDNPLPYFSMEFVALIASVLSVFIVGAVTTPTTLILYTIDWAVSRALRS